MSIPLRVLLIEDSADDALLILHELRRGGYEPEWRRVDTAVDLRRALEQPEWDLITCDYVMPAFGGLEALAVIHEVGCDAPVIIVSGEVGEEVATVALTNGAHDFVSKHNLTRLVPAIGRELRESDDRRARQLAETTARFQAKLLDAAGQAIIAVDPDGLITYWNRCAEALYGWPAAEVVGRHILEVAVATPDPKAAADVMARLRRGDTWSGEYTARRRDGTTFRALTTNSPVHDTSGAMIAIIGVPSDITERKRPEEEIRRLNTDLEQRVRARTQALELANQELESFSYSVSHDLRAPLRAINGYTQILLEDYADALVPESRHFLERVCDAAKRMEHLIEDLLGLSRVIQCEMRRQSVDLSAHAAEIAAELRRAEPERTVEVTLAAGLVVEGDERLLRVALENLLGNAWKYSGKHERARIELGTLSDDGQRVYFVRDDGAGFDPAYAQRLFGAFQRMHAASDFEGTGIGLATVQRIIHRHGGRIWAEGAVERGATFYFTLPSPEV